MGNTNSNLHLSFDVGHSSIGWAVLETTNPGRPQDIDILGCGAVTFRADDCLASARRDYRRQRRHIRSTRQRIKRMKLLLAHLGVLTERELDKPGCAWPWKLAARVLGGKLDKPTLLSWSELWDVLRWYGHNRGYDGNRRWSAAEVDIDEGDSEKEQNAKSLMGQYRAKTMAETVCAVCGIDPMGEAKSSNPAPENRFKSKNAAFPREVVEAEVRCIIQAHIGKLKGVDQSLERALLGTDSRDRGAWKAIPCPSLKISSRYEGGLLFGQLVPRFDNRIISKCVVSGEKVPLRDCPEFMNYRWGMILANIRIGSKSQADLRPLSVKERAAIDLSIRENGYFTANGLQQCVRKETSCGRDNLETMLMHPDAKDALIVDPLRKLVTSDKMKTFWPILPVRLQKRFSGQWRRGKAISLSDIRQALIQINEPVESLDVEIQRKLDSANTKVSRKTGQLTREALLSEKLALPKLSGRAPYASHLLAKAFREVMQGKHPKEEGGCLFVTEEMRNAQLNRPITDQTNNHLVRHRLLILERLFDDILKEYAKGKKDRVSRLTIEVNRDLRQMSGKTAKEKAQDLGLRVANHHAVAQKLEIALAGKVVNGRPIPITASLIRKARIADDLGWKCPYTGQVFEPIHLVTGQVDKDHIVPRSERASDSLDSLVITYSAVNKWKGKRTAWQFVSEEQGKVIPDLPHLSILSLTKYRQLVESLECFKGHEDDKNRKRRRKDFMLLPSYEEQEFTPRDLTQTSQLVRLGAQALKRKFAGCKRQPIIISLPGSVTGTVRKAWKILGCLGLANPQVLDESGNVKSKTEIRDITHLHHALDACVLGLASHFIPNNGRVWDLIVKRRLNEAEQRELKALGVFGCDSEGRFQMRDLDNRLKEQIRQRLAEKRVVQHVPARMDGLRVEQNIWRVVSVKGDTVKIQQRMRGLDGKLGPAKIGEEKAGKLLGLSPEGSGKLKALKGVLVIPDNFGLALDPVPAIIPFHKVHTRLEELRLANNGKWPRFVRNGQIIKVSEGNFKGVWKVFSAKNNATGIALDIGFPDIVRLQNKTPGNKINVRLNSLIAAGMTIAKTPLTGMVCPTTSSA